MKSSASEMDQKDEKAFEPVPECEWHTKDPLTGEIFFLSKGILYSKLPSKEKKKIISINTSENEIIQKEENPKKDEQIKKNNSVFLCNSAKFSNTQKGSKVLIFGGQSIANTTSQNDSSAVENYVIVTNIFHIGIVELEFICPISCYNLLFGMISQKDLENNNIAVKQLKNFKTSSRRNVIMKINYWKRECSFFLNDIKANSFTFQENDIIPIVVIKKKTSCVILNPLVKYYLTPIKTDFFDKEILFKIKDKIKINDEQELKDYLAHSFNKGLGIKSAFGDISLEGYISNFIFAEFDENSTKEINNNFSTICTNKNLSLPNNKTIKEIKKNLTNSYDLSYLNEQAYLTKLNSNYTANDENKKKDNNIDEDFKNTLIKYLISNFEQMKIYKNQSISDIKNKYLEFKNSEKEDIFDFMKPFSDNNQIQNGNEDNNSQDLIDYIKKGDCLLMIKKNKLKVIQRENSGLFDLTNFIEIDNQNINGVHYVIYEKDDLEFLLKNFDIQTYISYCPSLKKIKVLLEFLDSIQKGEKIGNNKILLIQSNVIFFYSSLIGYLNFVSFVTKRYKILNQTKKADSDLKKSIENVKSQKSIEKESKEKENLNIMNVFPFGCFGDESEEDDIQSLNDSIEKAINYEEYIEFVFKDPLIHAKLLKIINKIIVQLSTKSDIKIFGNNNMLNSYQNLASFVNYPFSNKIPLTSLSDKGFYCENAFTNELKIYDYNHKLVDTDMLNTEENIELYLKENIPSYLPNSSLKDLSTIINSSYNVNNMNFITENNDKIELYHINEKVPILATCSKQGLVNIYSFALGLKKLGSVNILKGIKKPQNFAEIGDIIKLKSFNQVKSFDDFLNNKKSLSDNYGKKIVDMGKNSYYFKPKVQEVIVDEESLKNLITMGFKREVCIKALKEKKNNFEEAIDYILSNPDISENLYINLNDLNNNNNASSKNFIGKWTCPSCTYENDGLEKCEMCETKIPEELYEKFLNNYSKGIPNEKKKEEPKKEEKKENKIEEKKDLNLMEDDEVIYKDVLIKNIHICYDPYGSDPFAPFVLVAILFNYVENKIIVNTYRLMINPLCISSFIQFNTGKYSENITNRREIDLKSIMSILNQKHFYNVNILYPIFIGENKNNLNNNNNYIHLIPIDNTTHEIKVQSFFDSCIYNYNYYEQNHKVKPFSLFAINEEPERNFMITEYKIQTPLYYFDNNKKSNIIIVSEPFTLSENMLKNALQKISCGEIITELKIFQDENLLYILAKGGYISISKKNKNIVQEKIFKKIEQIGLLKRVVPLYDKSFKEIIEFIIYDEKQSVNINVKTDKEEIKEEEIVGEATKDEDLDLDQLNINSLSINEIENLSNFLDTEKIEIILPKNGESININICNNEVKGLTKINDNYYNRIYFNINNKKGKIKKTIKLKKSKFVLSTDVEIAFNLKYNLIEKNPINIVKKSKTKIQYNEIISKAITKEDLYNYKNLIPLTVYDYKGAQSQYSINVSNLVTGAHRFISNYPKPEYLFSHLNNEIMIIDNVIISSDVIPKSVDNPFGEGLLFLMNSLDSIDKAREKFSSFTFSDFEKFINEKKTNNEDIYDYEPVCYLKMGENEIISSNLVKSKKCKYIYLLPVNGRDGNIKNFETQLMSFLFFGVQGKVSLNNCERLEEDKSNYIFAKFGNKSIIDYFKIEIYGYKSKEPSNRILIGSNDKFIINDFLLNKDIDCEFYLSRKQLNNYHKSIIDTIDIEITNNVKDSDLFEMISASMSFTTFKSFKKQKNSEKNALSTEKKDDSHSMYNKLLSEFYKLILNKNLFDKFIMKFIPCLVDESCDKNKKIAILRYFNLLFLKRNDIKSKIIIKLDYYNFIIQNILNDNNNSLSNLSINFIIESSQNQSASKLIEESFNKILNEFKDIEFTNNGFKNFIKLLSIIPIEQNTFKEKALALIKLCIKNIEENKYQSNEITYLNTFLFLNNYPSDQILFNSSIQENITDNKIGKENNLLGSQNKKVMCRNFLNTGTCKYGNNCVFSHENKDLFLSNQSSSSNISSSQTHIKILNGINYRGNIQYHKESLNGFLCMKETYIIEEFHIYFDDSKNVIPAQGYNFRLQIYKIQAEKDFELKSSKYFYDHNWKLLTKTYGKTKSNIKNKDLKDKYYNDEESQAEDSLKKENIRELNYLENQNNILKINFKKWNNEFSAHYLYFELSINDGTKEMNQIPNIVIFPVLIGHRAPEQLQPIENYEKLYSFFSIYKKVVHSKITEINYSEPNYDKKRFLIEYNDVNLNNNKIAYDEKKNKISNKNSDLINLYSTLNSKNKNISKKINILVDKKKSKEEKEKAKNDILEICKNIEALQNNINDFNPKTKLNKSLSFNVQLLKVLIIELNNKKDLELGDIYDIVIQLIYIISFNQVSYKEIYDQIFNFINNNFFKKATKEQKEKLFENLTKKYISTENIYRNVRTIIDNKIWNLFDISLFISELKKCFDEKNKDLWENKNFSKIFYKTSILILIIKKKLVNNEERELLNLKNMSEDYIQFINRIINNKNILKPEYSNLILKRILSLYYDHLLLTDKYERIKNNEPEKNIDFLIELLYINQDQQIKDKIENIVQLLLDPYKKEEKKENQNNNGLQKPNIILPVNAVLEEPKKEKEKDEKKDEENQKKIECYGDKIIIMIQKKILKFIEIIGQNKFIDNDDNKMEYVLSLLNTSYSLKQSEDKDSETLIKKQNNQIIEGFIKISSLFKDNRKLGFSNINNFWRYLTNLLEKGTLKMMFYNNNFITLVINCYLNLDRELQILLYTKLTKLFMVLYTKNNCQLTEDISTQILKVIIHIMKNNLKNENEEHLLDFMNNLLEILFYGNYSNYHNNKDLKINTQNFLNVINNENNLLLIKELFILSSQFLLLKLNYSSFGECECGNKLIYKRSLFMENILLILELYIKIFYNEIKEEDIKKEDFRKSLKNYLIFLIFNNVKEKSSLPPVLANIVKIREHINKIINSCTEKKELIKSCLENIMIILKKVDEITYDKIKKGSISFKKGLKILTKLFNTLLVLLNVLLVNDEITKYFAFELEGFKFFIDRINLHNLEKNTDKKEKIIKKEKKNLNLIGGVNEMASESEEEEEEQKEESGEINEELLKMEEISKNELNSNNLLDNKSTEFLNKFMYFESKKKSPLYSDLLYKSLYNNPFLPNYKNTSYIEEKLNKYIKNDELDSSTFNGDLSQYKSEEFATTKRLNIFESNGVLLPANTYNWANKKKPTNGYIINRDMKDNQYYEENIDYQLNYPIDLKEVLITFSQNIKLTEEFPEVYMECGLGLNKMDVCVKLERIKDEQYNERAVIAYSFNFYSNKPELIKDDDNFIENYLNQTIKCHAQYFRFIIRRPIILSNKNTHIADINNNKLIIGINCVSLIGVKFVNQIKVLDYIGEKEKNISIKIISTIFTSEFIETLRYIAQDKSIFQNIKQIYNAFEPNINRYVSILSKILINASKFNFDLGEWLLHRLLNIDHGKIYAKFAVEIMKNNPEYVDKRINKYCSFLFKEINNCVEKNKLENIGYFIEYFCLTLNGLLLSPFISKIKINIDLDEVRNIMFNLHKYKQIKKELINLITIILLPHDKIILNENEIDSNKFYHPNNSLKTLTDLYNNSYSYDYTELLSFLVSNNLRFEKVFVENEAAKYFCELILDEINSGIRGRNMLFMTEMLKNMSYNSEFTSFIRKNDYDFKLFESIKTKNEKSDSILINNNSTFLKNIVLFLRNCISGNEECYKRLANILINDLNICKQKIDKEYANKVLIPLLSLEKVTYVCVHPINEKIKSNYCSYINLESNNENVETEEKKTDDKSKEVSVSNFNLEKNKKKQKINLDNIIDLTIEKPLSLKYNVSNKMQIYSNKKEPEPEIQNIKSIIPESDLSEEYQNEFTQLFTSFEYQKGQKFSNMVFKKVLSSKGLTSDKLRAQISNNVCNQGPFLVIIYPSKLDKYNKTNTFFFYNGIFPSLTLSQNIDESDENVIIPYNPQNMICQISEKNYIAASFKSEMDYVNFKEYELGSVTVEEESIIMSIMDIINLYLTDPKSSNINPYLENLNVFKKRGMEDFYYLSCIADYEIFIGKKVDSIPTKSSFAFNTYSNNKIIPFKYIDEIGSLNINYVKRNKYYHSSHPFCLTRDNPIFEIPSNVKMKELKEMFYSNLIPFKNLKNGEIIPDEVKIGDIEKFTDSNMIDIYYDIQSLKDFRSKIINGEIQPNIDFDNKISFNISEYEPNLPVLQEFENSGGINQIINVLKSTIKSWKNKNVEEFWLKWIDSVDKFSQLPSFFSSLIRHQKCFNIIFNLLCGIYDNDSSVQDIGIEASKYILEILDNSFAENKSNKLRQIAIDNGIFKSILEKLESLTHEKPRKYEPKTEEEEKEEEEKEKEKEKEREEKMKNENKNKKTKGVGYGSDKTGDNKSWDINTYLEGKKSNSSQIVVIIKLLINFFNSQSFEMNQNLMKFILESPILPCIESAFRGVTLLDISKDSELYMNYLQLTVVLSKNHSLIPLLLDISKDYKPMQTQSVYNLLGSLYESEKIFMNCLKQNTKKENSNDEKLAKEIINSYEIVSKNIKLYQSSSEHGKNYNEILKLPVEKSYPLLLRELSFDYMSMKDSNGKIVHYYSSQSSGEPTQTKAIRLAQEFADLPRALPCESTNSIYVRVDKDNMDLMKVLIIGSEGTPYSNGAFLFDVFFDNQYPNAPPKVTLMTTGGGSTRFNPNLYSNGKVCLSLLGTWRGNSTENWDPKISTLLQVLISIQSIIMSELVYFNEPSCESEMGTPSGEAKNEAYSNIVRYSNIKYAMIEQIKKPSLGFEEIIRRHFYLKKDQILKEVKGWIERSKTATAKYTSYSYDHNSTWANKFNKPGEYTKMLEEIYYELETTLNGLPLPQELKKKAEDEKIQTEKKVKKMKFENLDKVDMSYDDKKEQKSMNLNDDTIKDRWSRYIGAMGIEAVRRQANCTILVQGAGGLGIEIAKNLVLSGCKELVLQDNKKTTFYDLSSQFYLKENDIGKNRAESCIKKLQDLNYYVKVSASKENLPNDEKNMNTLKKYNVIVLTECDYETAIIINKFCRENKIFLIICEVYGAAGRLINDFGEEFIVNDKDGEDPKEIMVKNIKIKDEKVAEVTVLDGLRHDFSDNDLVEVIEVVGMEGINKRQFTIKSLSKDKFEINGDLKDIKDDYQLNGIVKQIKTQKKMKFLPIKDCLNSFTEEKHSKLIDSNMLISDFTKISNGFIINLAFTAINNYLRGKKYFENNKLICNPWNYNEQKSIMEIANQIISDNKIELNENQQKLLQKIIFTHMVQFSPLCAYLGGFAAQEVIKAITNKYSPANQIIYQDCLELIPDINIKSKQTIEESLKNINFKENNNRLDGLQVILGKKLLDKLINMKCLIVGAGAIGCELIKNFSMLNVGTGQNGSIYLTDPDIIEVSNLTRQFLFREKHLRLPKSSTAAAAAIQMNPNLSGHIFAQLDKVCEETENIFTDSFFSSLDFVANALDNVNARRYVDSRCVANRKPLLESGTLGPKGHVQVIIPFKTESYGSQNDPEVSNDIPQCTLKMFPEEAIHCVEWARDQFGKKFTQLPKVLNKRIEEAKNGEENNDMKITKKTLKWLKKIPKNFDDCLKIARDKYNKVFVLNIKQLLYSYPLDKKDKNGKLFWTLPKRPPVSLDYSIDDQLCIDFISAYACLMANMFNIKIPYDKPRDPKSKQDMIIKTKNMSVEEFKPNELKAKEIENEVESSENQEKMKEKEEKEKKEENKNKEKEEILYNKELINLVKEEKLGFSKMKPLTSVEFEKDDDSNFQIDIIYAMSALRCRNYKLEIMDWMTVKIKAGRIIPALATTTSSIAALQAVELVKIAKNSPIEEFRNSFLNLAIPLLQSSEPGACAKNTIREGLTTTLWDRWEIKLPQDQCTIKNLFEILKTKYLLFPRDIFKGKKPIYSYSAYKDKKEINEELINKKLNTLLLVDINKEEYVDLMITFTIDEKTEEYIKNVPKVRLFFEK